MYTEGARQRIAGYPHCCTFLTQFDANHERAEVLALRVDHIKKKKILS